MDTTSSTPPRVRVRMLKEYAEDLAAQGTCIIAGAGATFWRKSGMFAISRVPNVCLANPDPREVRHVLWQAHAAVASYLTAPDAAHPANAVLYLCTDHEYSLENLHPVMRRNVRRGLKELRIEQLNADQLLKHGVSAFCDTRARNRLDDGTSEAFRARFEAFVQLPESTVLGAWHGDELAAFMTITEVDDWAEIGGFSRTDAHPYRPNETLVYATLTRYLVERGFRVVSYGLSSVELGSSAVGLHRYKLKCGFEAYPVHRAFVPHPMLRPFVSPAVRWGVDVALHVHKNSRMLKKMQGVLASLQGSTATLQAIHAAHESA